MLSLQRISAERYKIFIVGMIILAAVLIRAYNINGALFDFNPLRQAVGTAIARNYALDPEVKILLPQADNAGAAPGYFMFEAPIIPYATSFLIKAVGSPNWAFRLPIILLFACSAIYFYKLCSLIVDFRTSALALSFYCIAPISILMGRVFQAESFMLCMLFSSLYYLIRWFKEEKTCHLLVTTLSLTILILLKITNFYVFLLIGSLFLIYKKSRLIPHFILPALFILTVNFWWWFVHSAGVRAEFPTEYTLVSGESFFGAKYLLERIKEFSFSFKYWSLIVRQTSWIIFSPILFILFLTGMFVKKKKEVSLFLLAWTGAVLFFIFAVPVAGMQDYYKIHFLPPGAILAAICCFFIFDKIKMGWKKNAIFIVFWIILCANIFLIVYPVVRLKPIFESQQVLGKKVEEMTKRDDLILTAFGPDAMLLYYCNRKGWSQYLPVKNDNIGLLEERRKEGAKYFVCGNLDELDSDPEFKKYLFNKYKLLSEKDRQYGEPQEGTLDYLMWMFLNKIDYPTAKNIQEKFERKSLGYVIFDLRRKF